VRVLVYPHSMELGGSQLNAIEIAAAVRDRGHEVLLLGEDGPLLATADRLGLEHVPLDPRARRRPSLYAAAQLARLARQRRLDLVHGYEWPPALEAFTGPRLRLGLPAVCTVMSMAVAPFLPRTMPLLVGTADIRRRALAAGHRSVTLLEPPVDVHANSPDFDPGSFRAEHGLDPHLPLVAVVCRLVPELKLEGLLAACAAVGSLVVSGVDVQLVVVGDGPARAAVAAAAARANAAAGRPVVALTGSLADPRPAYAAADVMLGMGGSALRGLAFGVPLVVQGERGFWRLLTPESAGTFLDQGWYGVGSDVDAAGGADRLAGILGGLLADPAARARLADYGRRLVVERFSLARAAAVQEEVYAAALAEPFRITPAVALDAVRSAAGVTQHKVRRRWQRVRGTVATDDFNAAALLHRSGPDRPTEETLT
jgi:glycosyltransferase involved in cell wall biosynthesis